MTKVIAISGGIGSGKSVVSKMLIALGYNVYDCDARAKKLMDAEEGIKYAISEKISKDVIVNSNIDRLKLSQIVFNDNSKLQMLNSIVHGAVKDDLRQWINNAKNDVVFVETAILYQSKLDEIVDEVWDVFAPKEIRILRVQKRNNMTREQVMARMKSQEYDINIKPRLKTSLIINDDKTAVLPQLLMFLKDI